VATPSRSCGDARSGSDARASPCRTSGTGALGDAGRVHRARWTGSPRGILLVGMILVAGGGSDTACLLRYFLRVRCYIDDSVRLLAQGFEICGTSVHLSGLGWKDTSSPGSSAASRSEHVREANIACREPRWPILPTRHRTRLRRTVGELPPPPAPSAAGPVR